MIVRRNSVSTETRSSEGWGTAHSASVGDAGGITQFGAAVQTLEPGARSSLKHWHEATDEMLLVISGEVTVLENDVECVLLSGDAACWPAGVAVAHTVANRSNAPCSFVVIGSRREADVTHYEEIGQVMHVRDGRWQMTDRAGRLLREGDSAISPWR